MLGLNVRGLLRALALCGLAAATLAAKPALAELRQSTVRNVSGATFRAVDDTATGLQWLTPQATMGLSYAQAAASDFAELGYRHATSGELLALLGHTGFDLDRLLPNLAWPYTSQGAADMAAMDSLVTLLGPTHVPGQPTGSNPYGDQYIFGVLADVDPSVANADMGHRLATIAIAGWGAYVVLPGSVFPTADGNVGSFLVRQASAVPEPTTTVMLAAGLMAVASRIRRPSSERR